MPRPLHSWQGLTFAPGAAPEAWFGSAVALDEHHVAVGAPGIDNGFQDYPGSVYVFD